MIEFGWDNPGSDFVRKNIVEMEKRPFAGFTMALSVGTNIFNRNAFAESEFTNDRNNLKATTFTTLSDNFIRMDTRHEAGWSWLNDSDWNAALENVRQTTRTAKIGNFKGIIFDSEPYGPNPWVYSSSAYGGKSYAEVAQVVRQRGRDFISAVHQEMPGAKILTTWFLSIIKRQLSEPGATLETNGWALLVPFVEGWFDAAQGEVFIDGLEDTYFAMDEPDYKVQRDFFGSAGSLLSSENQSKYNTLVSIAGAAYIDGILNQFYRSPRFVGYYFKSDEERRKILESNAYYGLQTATEYLWVYSERMNWWTGDIPAGIEAVYKSAIDKINAGKPLGFDVKAIADRTRTDYYDRIFIRGNATEGGVSLYQRAVIQSGFNDANGAESACFIYVDGQYDCQLPFGWTGTLTPYKKNTSFDPPMRDFSNLKTTPGKWIEAQDFTTK